MQEQVIVTGDSLCSQLFYFLPLFNNLPVCLCGFSGSPTSFSSRDLIISSSLMLFGLLMAKAALHSHFRHQRMFLQEHAIVTVASFSMGPFNSCFYRQWALLKGRGKMRAGSVEGEHWSPVECVYWKVAISLWCFSKGLAYGIISSTFLALALTKPALCSREMFQRWIQSWKLSTTFALTS